jgi:hypothetical protein
MNREDQPTVLSKGYEKPSDATNKAKSKTKKKQLPAANLLGVLRAVLQAEVLESSFDYLLLHRFCWRLLRGVKDDCCDTPIKIFGPDYLEREDQLPFVVDCVFMSMTDTMQIAGLTKRKKTLGDSSDLLGQAAEVAAGVVVLGVGNMVGRRLKDAFGIALSSGRRRRMRGMSRG